MKTLLKFLLPLLSICYFSLAVAEIKVRCAGQGPVVYLIGGGPAFTTWNLQPIQERLAKHYRVCRWDMRGTGENAGLVLEPEKPALSQWLDDMDEVITQEPVVLWGHSWGALQVLLFVKNHPEGLVKLILSNPVDPSLLSMEDIHSKLFSHSEIDGRLTLDKIGTPAEKLHNFHSKIASYFEDGKKGWNYALKFSPEDSNNTLNVRIWEGYKKLPLSDEDIKQQSDKIIGLIHCRNDVLQPESVSEYQRLLVKSKHHVINGCVHFPWEENPEDYFPVLLDLFEQKAGKSRM